MACIGRRVLVVDDDAATADLVSDVLALEGYQVSTAHSGLEAISMASEVRPDLVLLDLMMPVCSGEEVAQRLRSDGVQARVLVVSADSQAAQKARKMGAAGLLPKPFAIEDLVREVERQFL